MQPMLSERLNCCDWIRRKFTCSPFDITIDANILLLLLLLLKKTTKKKK